MVDFESFKATTNTLAIRPKASYPKGTDGRALAPSYIYYVASCLCAVGFLMTCMSPSRAEPTPRNRFSGLHQNTPHPHTHSLHLYRCPCRHRLPEPLLLKSSYEPKLISSSAYEACSDSTHTFIAECDEPCFFEGVRHLLDPRP